MKQLFSFNPYVGEGFPDNCHHENPDTETQYGNKPDKLYRAGIFGGKSCFRHHILFRFCKIVASSKFSFGKVCFVTGLLSMLFQFNCFFCPHKKSVDLLAAFIESPAILYITGIVDNLPNSWFCLQWS
jgi:hypothetical protein